MISYNKASIYGEWDEENFSSMVKLWLLIRYIILLRCSLSWTKIEYNQSLPVSNEHKTVVRNINENIFSFLLN